MPNKRKASKSDDADSSAREEEDPTEETQESIPKRKSDQAKKNKTVWSASEDDALLKAVIEDQQDREAEGDGEEEEDWDEIAKSVAGKTPVQCFKRYMILNSKKTSAPPEASISSVKEEAGEGEEEEEVSSPATKKAKTAKTEFESPTASSSSAKWSPDEVELLKKLVEQYKDSKFQIHSIIAQRIIE